MRFRASDVVLKLLFFAFCFTMLAGCGMIEFPSKIEFGSNWVSPEGKSKEQLIEDQRECKRDMMLMSPQFPGSGMGGGGYDMSDIKAFNNCMRSKGWVKE
jgi:hypothetical protein